MKNSIALFALVNLISLGAFAAPKTLDCVSAATSTTYRISLEVPAEQVMVKRGTAVVSQIKDGHILALTPSDKASKLICSIWSNQKKELYSLDCRSATSVSHSEMSLAITSTNHYKLHLDDTVSSMNPSLPSDDMTRTIISVKGLTCRFVTLN